MSVHLWHFFLILPLVLSLVLFVRKGFPKKGIKLMLAGLAVCFFSISLFFYVCFFFDRSPFAGIPVILASLAAFISLTLAIFACI